MPTEKKPIWGTLDDRKGHLDKVIRKRRLANYGFEKIPEDEKTQRVIQHFNSVAEQYDFMNTLLSFGIHYAWKRAAIRMMELHAGDRVIDVCGGTGDLAVLAARKVGRRGSVVIYDINRAMIDAGRHNPGNGHLRRHIQCVQGNAERIAFPNNCFDAATVGFGIRNVTRMEQGFREMFRVLKPGGRLMCLEFSKPTNPVFRWLYDKYSIYGMPFLGELIVGNRQAYTHLPESIRMFPLPVELSRILKGIGFQNVRYRSLTNGIAVIHMAFKKLS